jgi:rubrerythrin
MPKKISKLTVSKMVQLYLQGKSETEIAEKLGVDQSTVSKHKSEFEALAQKQGLEEASAQYGVAEEIEELHNLSLELHDGHQTIAEAKVGFKMNLLFQQIGIKSEEYTYCIKALKRMKDEGFISSAIILTQLEDSTGMTCQEVVSQAVGADQKLQSAQLELQSVNEKLGVTKLELADAAKHKKEANENLKEYLEKVDVDMHRIELIEALALVLKEAAIPNKQIGEWIKRQEILNHAGISIDLFSAIVNKAHVSTSNDGGKNLLEMLTEYNGLDGAVKTLKQQEQVLTLNVKDLKEKAKSKGQLEAETLDLESKQASLEFEIPKLNTLKANLGKEVHSLQQEIERFIKQRGTLEQDVSDKQKLVTSLDAEIASKQQNNVDLDMLQSKYIALVNEMTQVEARLDKEKGRLLVLDGFLGLIKMEPLRGTKAFAAILPELIAKVETGEYSPEKLRGFILDKMTGGTLKVWRCSKCGANFQTDKPAGSSGYRCPVCTDDHKLVLGKLEIDILNPLVFDTLPHKIEPVVGWYLKSSPKISSTSDMTEKPEVNPKTNP